jgi:hypothetical protein
MAPALMKIKIAWSLRHVCLVDARALRRRVMLRGLIRCYLWDSSREMEITFALTKFDPWPKFHVPHAGFRHCIIDAIASWRRS